jgi:ActR/RegA family two-component response regulator
MATSGLPKNPVPLYNLLRQDVRMALDEQIILAEDLYFRDVLIIKAGSYLDDQTIYRLLNFGVKRVNLLLPEDKPKKQIFENLSIVQLKKEYLRQQKCIIADKDGHYLNELINTLTVSYVKDTNIYAVNNSIPLKNLIEDKHPRFIFVDLNLYPNHGLKVIKEIKKHTTANLFLTALVDQSKIELVEKLRNEVELMGATLLFKPVKSAQLRVVLMNTVSNQDVSKFLSARRYQKKAIRSA